VPPQAAERFGVSASSAIRWLDRPKKQGGAAANRQGGGRKPGRIEAEAAFLLARGAHDVDRVPRRPKGRRGHECRLHEAADRAGFIVNWNRASGDAFQFWRYPPERSSISVMRAFSAAASDQRFIEMGS